MIAWNSNLGGLGIRTFPSGRQSWIFVRRVLGKQKWHTLGLVGVVPESEALRMASEINSRADSLVAPPSSSIHFRDVARAWLEARASLKTIDQCRRRLDGRLLPRLGNKRLNEITPLALQSLHAEWSKTAPFEANRLIDLTSSILSFAVRMGFIATNPARGVMKNVERPRRRFLDDEEIPRLYAAIDAEPELVTRVALRFILASGMRKNEALRMKWENIKRSPGQPWALVVENTKNGSDFRIELPSQLCAELKKVGEKEKGWVFPARIGPGHLSRIENAWGRVRLRAGLPDARMHDMRRTFVRIAASCGHEHIDIARAVNHADTRMLDRHYLPHSDETKARVISSVSKHLKKLRHKKAGASPGLEGE